MGLNAAIRLGIDAWSQPERSLRILVVFAHPLETSFVSGLHARVVEILRAGGHIVDDLDLYAEKFDPVMSREGLRHYVDTSANTREVEAYVRRLREAEALILVFPVWFDGLPAIMQGYFQRVFVPGVSVRIDETGLFHPNLRNIKRMAAVCASGSIRAPATARCWSTASRAMNSFMISEEPSKMRVMRRSRRICSAGTGFSPLALSDAAVS